MRESVLKGSFVYNAKTGRRKEREQKEKNKKEEKEKKEKG